MKTVQRIRGKLRTIRRAFLNADERRTAMSCVRAEGNSIRWVITDCNRQIELDFDINRHETRAERLEKLRILDEHLQAVRMHVLATAPGPVRSKS